MISEIEHPEELRHGLGPIWLAARVANPGFTTLDTVTFHAETAFSISASAWRQTVFAPILLPALRAALHHTRRGELRELSALDRKLSDELSDLARDGSLRAGRWLAAQGCDLAGDRLLLRLGKWIRAKRTPGHLATLFTARCAAFSLPDRIAVGAYLFQEMCAGAPTASISEVCDFVAACLEPPGEFSFELRAA